MKLNKRLIAWAGAVIGAMIPFLLINAYLVASFFGLVPGPVWVTPFYAPLMTAAVYSLMGLCGVFGFAITKRLVGHAEPLGKKHL